MSTQTKITNLNSTHKDSNTGVVQVTMHQLNSSSSSGWCSVPLAKRGDLLQFQNLDPADQITLALS